MTTVIPPDVGTVLQNITSRLQALEGQNAQTADVMSQDDVMTEPPDEVSWDSILPQQLVTPSDNVACALATLCGVPPPLGQIREALTKIVQYQNVPQTASPRRSKPDQALYQAQLKMEELMDMYIHLAETKDMQHLTMATALARSAWEDL